MSEAMRSDAFDISWFGVDLLREDYEAVKLEQVRFKTASRFSKAICLKAREKAIRSLEVAFGLFLFHRSFVIVVNHTTLSLGGGR